MSNSLNLIMLNLIFGGKLKIFLRFSIGYVFRNDSRLGVRDHMGCWGLNPGRQCTRQAPYLLHYLFGPTWGSFNRDKYFFFLNDKLFTIFHPLGLYLLELETFLAQKLVALPCSLHVCALQPLFSSRTEEARRGWSMKTFLLVPSSTRRWVPSCYHGLHKLGESCSQEVSPARHP